MGIWASIFGVAAQHDATQTAVEQGITEIMRRNPKMPRYGEGYAWEHDRPSWEDAEAASDAAALDIWLSGLE